MTAADPMHVRAHLAAMRERDTAAFAALIAAMNPLPGESGAEHAARVETAIGAFMSQGAEIAVADLAALAVAAQRDTEAGGAPSPPFQPNPGDVAWQAALAAAARSAAKKPKAWALIRGVLGASFPAPTLKPAGRIGAARLEALCAAAAAAESRIASVESAASAASLVRYFEAHQGRSSAAVGEDLRKSDDNVLRLSGEVEACRLLWEL